MAKLRDLNVNIYEGSNPLQSLRDSIMTGRSSMGTALVFNLINDLVDRIEKLEAAPKCNCKEEKLAQKPATKSTPRKAAAKNASNQNGGRIDDAPKVAEEPVSE